MKQKPLKSLGDAFVYSRGSVVVLTTQDLVNGPTCTDPTLNKNVFKAAASHTLPDDVHVSITEMKDAQPDDDILELSLPLPCNFECI
jgi:hypothetical protein